MNNTIKYTLLLALLIGFILFDFSFSYNELDVLPFAYQTFNPEWIPADWYLNLPITYRYLFSYNIGFFIELFGFTGATIIGRIISYLLFAYASIKLTETDQKQPFTAINMLPVVAFFAIFKNGLGAGEWLIGGLETKAFAYPFILLALYQLHQKNLNKALFFSGLALNFHILIGAFHVFALTVVLGYWYFSKKVPLATLIKAAPYFLLGGPIGIYEVFDQLFLQPDSLTQLGWIKYVTVRVPFHVLPTEFSTDYYLKLGVFALANFILIRQSKFRNLALYNLVLLSFALFGFVLFFGFHQIAFMRYYWFRMSDALLPFLTLIALSIWVINTWQNKQNAHTINKVAMAFSAGIAIAFFSIHLQSKPIQFHVNEDVEMSNWVLQNTPKNSVIITTPYYDHYYLNYQRAQFVSWKHAPQSNSTMFEWYNRLKLLNQNQDFTQIQEVLSNFKKITTADVLRIKQAYSVDYILVQKRVQLDFPVAYQSSKYKLYQLN